MKLFEIKNCKKSFNDLNVLNDISLSVEEGEVVAVIGPSGSGNLRCSDARRCWRKWTTGN